MKKKLFLVVNPCSGTRKIKPALLQVVQIFSEAGYCVTVYPTSAPQDATRVVRTLPKSYDLIVCSGGDGTLNEVITGMLEGGHTCRLGYLPAGTLNEWSSGLKMSGNLLRAARDVVEGIETPLDIGRFCDRYFSYTASFGAFTEASYSTPQDVKNVLGQAAYFFEGIKSLGNIKPHTLSVQFDDGSVCEGDFIFGAVSNSLSVGGVLKYRDTRVKLNDGVFEVVLVRKPEHASQLQGIVSALLCQNFDDFSDPCLEFRHTSSLTVTGGENLPWTLDGEQASGADRTEISILHDALRFVIPKRAPDKILAAAPAQ